jgi:hypothetical protein
VIVKINRSRDADGFSRFHRLQLDNVMECRLSAFLCAFLAPEGWTDLIDIRN